MSNSDLDFILIKMVFSSALYIYVMGRMAGAMPAENSQKKHLLLKILGSSLFVLATIIMATGIYMLTQVNFSTNRYDPTLYLNMTINGISASFSMVGWAVYCFAYKKSDRTWWRKVLRVLQWLLLFLLWSYATGVPYFNLSSLLGIAMYIGLSYYIVTKADNQKIASIKIAPKRVMVEKPVEPDVVKEHNETDHTRYMPKSVADAQEMVVDEIDVPNEKEPVENNAEKHDGELEEDGSSYVYKQVPDEKPVEPVVVKEYNETDHTRYMPQSVADDSDLVVDEIDMPKKKEPMENIAEKRDENFSDDSKSYVKESDKVRFCSHCGKSVDYDSDVYCKYCGTKL